MMKSRLHVFSRIAVTLCIVLFSLNTYAQGILVSGTITSTVDNSGIPGVNIVVKGTTTGTVTDLNGKYQLNVPSKKSELVISAIGYVTETVPLNGKTSLSIAIKEDIETLDEVVVIGYGQQEKREVTGAIAQVKSEDIVKLATSDIASAIQGQMAGVTVQSAGGSPGENATITIRGVTSFQDGGSEPLYVVDGVTYTSNPNISPQEIESFEVLKDGASAAIYGSRASAGVILITTKKGKAGQMKVNLDSYYGVQKITSGIELANTMESLYIAELQDRGYDGDVYNPLEQVPNGLYHNTNWLNELLVDNAVIQNHSLRLSGGTKNLTYSVVGSMFDQEGVIIGSSFERQNVRANTSFTKGKLKAQVSVGLSRSYKDEVAGQVQYDAIKQQPYRQGLSPEGSTFEIDGPNPEKVAGFMRKLIETNDRFDNGYNGNARLTYTLFKGLTLGANIGGSVSNTWVKRFQPAIRVFNVQGDLVGQADRRIATLTHIETENVRSIQEYTLNYKKNFKSGHSLGVLFGNTWETSELRRVSMSGRDFPGNDIQVIGAANEILSADERVAAYSNIGILGRLQYNYKKRYMLSTSIRVDGSSRFNPDNKWGQFRSVSLGWNISEEAFFAGMTDYVNVLKIRYGYGETGSDKAGQGLGSLSGYLPYESIATPLVDYVLGGGDSENLVYGTTVPGYADQTIKWETNISQNLGIDAEFFEGRLNLTVDLYRADKRDMLLAVDTPLSSGAINKNGYNKLWQNVGNLTNKGIEVALGYNNKFGDLGVKLFGTFTKNVNEVTALAPSLQSISGGQPINVKDDATTFLMPGYIAGAFMLIPTDGTIQTAEELEAYKHLDANAALGDLKYVDTNGDGSINQGDRVFMGSGTPEWEAGFSLGLDYKGFDLNVQLYGTYGAQVFNGSKMLAYQTKRSRELMNAWSTANSTSDIPTPRTSSAHNNVRSQSDYFLEDGSYLRIQNIALGYTLPTSLLSKVGVNKMRVYVSAQNPITFTKYSGFDPEVGSRNVMNRGVDKGNYPVSVNYRVGTSIEF